MACKGNAMTDVLPGWTPIKPVLYGDCSSRLIVRDNRTVAVLAAERHESVGWEWWLDGFGKGADCGDHVCESAIVAQRECEAAARARGLL